jgi:tetratricopeptide (TPR) repeat protein
MLANGAQVHFCEAFAFTEPSAVNFSYRNDPPLPRRIDPMEPAMSDSTILCPQCNALLRISGPPTSGRMFRCPQCSHHFTTEGDTDIPEAPAVTRSATVRTGLIAFGSLASVFLFIGGGLAFVAVRNGEKENAVAKERHAHEQRLAGLQKELDEQHAAVVRAQREREQALRDLEKKASAPSAPAPTIPVAPVDPPVRARPPIAPAVQDPVAAAEAPRDRNRTSYLAHMDAGRSDMVNERYADALVEYKSALQLMPGDADATRGVRDAEDRLGMAQDRTNRRNSVAAALDRARSALKSKRYDDAISAAKEALALAPGDTEAKQIQRDASAAKRAAQSETSQLLAQADAARAAGRYEEASQLYGRVLQVSPDDDNAQRGKKAADQALTDFQAGLNAYFRFMALGTLSMQNLQFADASRAFAEALRLMPTDLAAARGLRDSQLALAGVVAGQVNYYRQLQAGYSALQSRQPQAAVTAFQAALQLVPGSPLAAAGLQQAQAMKK